MVDVEDVMDEFHHGIVTPTTIHRFLAYAHRNWRKAPRYVLLVGKATARSTTRTQPDTATTSCRR